MEFEGDVALPVCLQNKHGKKIVAVVNKQISRLIPLTCYVCVVATHAERMNEKPGLTIGIPGIT